MVIMPVVLVFSSVKMCAESAAGIYWIHGRKGRNLFGFWIENFEIVFAGRDAVGARREIV